MKQAPKRQPLNTKAKGRICLIIDPKKGQPTSEARTYLQAVQQALSSYSRFTFWATIIHDQDKEEDGTPKLIHVHAVLEFFDNGETLKDMLQEICELIDAEAEQVSIETSNNPYLIVQYLKHNGKPEKHQYDESLILTNDSQELANRLHQEYVKPVDPVQEAVKSSDTLMTLMDQIGLEKANKYRGLWKELHAESQLIASFQRLKDDYSRLQSFLRELFDHLLLTGGRLEPLQFWLDEAERLDVLNTSIDRRKD